VAVRTVLGLVTTVVALAIAGCRVLYLYRMATAGQPAEPERTIGGAARTLGSVVRAEVAEGLVQRRLLQWTVPGLARLAAFAIIRWRNTPQTLGRRSRFFGSHLDAAWLVLFMIFNVVSTLLLYRGAQIDTGYVRFERGAYASDAVARVLAPPGRDANTVIEHVGVLLAIGVVFGFLVLVVHSKHLHIFTAPLDVAFARRRSDAAGAQGVPGALGALQPVYSGGRPVDFEDPGEDDLLGRGTIADFTWKGVLDLLSCTECGRCQSQCPAWNTGKPLSPKLLVMGLRDHALARAPYALAADDQARAALPEAVRAEGARPLVGAPDADEAERAVVPFDVLWSCTTCGACVNQCPVDIEHLDHIVGMRRYQTLVEGAFPAEAEVMLRNLEHAGDPWGRGASARAEWMTGLAFEVPVFGANGEERPPDDVEYLFWVGCAGVLDDKAQNDKAQNTSRAVATLVHRAGVRYRVLGAGDLGRPDQIFAPPREVLGAVPGTRVVEMARSGERSFCCGAGGARMWMDETIGERINTHRAREALDLTPDLVAAACPFCIVMLTDGVRAVDAENGADAAADPSVEVTDIAEVLLRACAPAVPHTLEGTAR